MYYLYLQDENNKYYIEISCLRNIRFGEHYEWICNPNYLLYFQYLVIKYEKPQVFKQLV